MAIIAPIPNQGFNPVFGKLLLLDRLSFLLEPWGAVLFFLSVDEPLLLLLLFVVDVILTVTVLLVFAVSVVP